MTAFLWLYGFALIPIGFALLWARASAVPRNQRLLRRSAVAATLVYLVVFGIFAVSIAQCNGNWLYGFSDCQLVSDRFANAYSSFVFLALLAGIVFASGLFIYSAVLEILHARRSDR